MQRVFHSIRFKVNKVGIQWYPIFFALHLGLIGKQPLFFLPLADLCSRSPCCLPWGGFRLCYDASNRTAPRPSTPWGGTQKRAFPHRTAQWCLATETTAIVRWGNALSSFATALGLAAPVGTVVGRRRGWRQHQLYLRG